MLSAESIDGNAEEKATSMCMVEHWVREKGSRLRDSTLLPQRRSPPGPKQGRGY